MNYINEIDPFAAQWCRNLIDAGHLPPAAVDPRSINDVEPDDLAGYDQCHFFAGIAGWPLALALAGWDATRPVWTGSCPCQPYSSAGKRKGHADERDLWPAFSRLIRECRPVVVFGEQVPGAIGHGWLDRVHDDLEPEGYAVGAVVLGAFSAGAPHQRQRLYWGADMQEQRQRQRAEDAGGGREGVRAEGAGRGPADDGRARGVGDAEGVRRPAAPRPGEATQERQADADAGVDGQLQARPGGSGWSDRLADADGGVARDGDVQRGGEQRLLPAGGEFGPWDAYRIAPCRDGKSRRFGAEPGDEPLAPRIPAKLGPLLPRLGELGHDARSARRIHRESRRNRVGRLAGYGNALCVETAVMFIRAYMDCRNAVPRGAEVAPPPGGGYTLPPHPERIGP